jgi:hypothetical protein
MWQQHGHGLPNKLQQSKRLGNSALSNGRVDFTRSIHGQWPISNRDSTKRLIYLFLYIPTMFPPPLCLRSSKRPFFDLPSKIERGRRQMKLYALWYSQYSEYIYRSLVSKTSGERSTLRTISIGDYGPTISRVLLPTCKMAPLTAHRHLHIFIFSVSLLQTTLAYSSKLEMRLKLR